MMISYLDIRSSRQLVIDYNIADLLDLVRFTFVASGLQVQNFCHAITGENVMASFNAFLKTHPFQECDHSCKRDVRVRTASKNLVEKFLATGHGALNGAQA
jgi:hypothetical protein